jgi:hypothetical protein
VGAGNLDVVAMDLCGVGGNVEEVTKGKGMELRIRKNREIDIGNGD